MRTRAQFVCVLALLATHAAAQTATEDGIRAALSGDYQAAVRILRPLAADAERPDPVAQFFLAILYDAGVAGDRARACGLYLRAASRPNPFSQQAAALAAARQAQLGGAASPMCVADERWQNGPPQSFVLGPGHRVVFADTSITVTYGDRETQMPVLLHGSAAFLPVQYTPVDVQKPIAVRRHFFQWFEWRSDPATNPPTWTLGWVLSEVVGAQWMPITGDKSLAVLNGAAPPVTFDMRRLVRLRANGGGEAELTIFRGTSPQIEVIPWQGKR